MSLATIDSAILPLTLPLLPGATDTLTKQLGRRAMRDLLHRVPLWETELSINAVEDQADYVLDVSSISAHIYPLYILKLKDDSEAVIQQRFYSYDGTKLSFSRYYIPTANKADAWTATIHLAPTPTCTEFPDYLFEQHADAIAGRVLELAAGQRGRPWYNPALEEQGRRDFRRGVQQARITIDGESIFRG